MRWIKYNLCTRVNKGTEENPQWEDELNPVRIGYSVENEAMVKAEAYNGEYTIEDDGQPEVYQPSIQEQLDAQAAAIMELMGVVYNG